MGPIENSYVVSGTRLIAGEYPGSPPGTPAPDVEARLACFIDFGVTVFIDLTGPADGLYPYEETLRAFAVRQGVEINYERFAIRDMDVSDKQHMSRVLDFIDRFLLAGRTVYVHCWGGVGRTGLVIGCWLVRHGMTGENALNAVARSFATMSKAKQNRHREGSPQTGPQRAMVQGWNEGVVA